MQPIHPMHSQIIIITVNINETPQNLVTFQRLNNNQTVLTFTTTITLINQSKDPLIKTIIEQDKSIKNY
jgi:hypothetical protein